MTLKSTLKVEFWHFSTPHHYTYSQISIIENRFRLNQGRFLATSDQPGGRFQYDQGGAADRASTARDEEQGEERGAAEGPAAGPLHWL